MGKLSSAQEMDCCDYYKQGVSSYQLGKRYGVSAGTICHILVKHGINRRPLKAFSEAQESWICEAHSKGMSYRELSQLFGVATGTVYNVLKRHGVDTTHHKLHIDDLFFERIDTLEKAYWLGFITADGYICKGKLFRLVLSSVDEPHLEKIKSALHYEGIIRSRVRDRYSQSALQVYNKTFVTYLGKALDRNKIVVMPRDLLSHFVRGLIDGDGCTAFHVYKPTGRHYLLVNLCAKKSFLMDFVHKIPFNYTGSFYPSSKNGDVCRIQFSGFKALSLLNWMYKDSTDSTRLDRKYERYLKALSLAKSGKLGGVK